MKFIKDIEGFLEDLSEDQSGTKELVAVESEKPPVCPAFLQQPMDRLAFSTTGATRKIEENRKTPETWYKGI